MDLSPDIDPTEISRIFKSTTLTTQISYYLDNQMIGINSLGAVKSTNKMKGHLTKLKFKERIKN